MSMGGTWATWLENLDTPVGVRRDQEARVLTQECLVDLLFSEALQRSCTAGHAYSRELLAPGGLPVASWQDACNLRTSGASLQFRHLEHQLSNDGALLPFASEMARLKRTDLMSISCFTSSNKSIGIEAHADETDVLTLQFVGSKCWNIYHDQPTDHPLLVELDEKSRLLQIRLKSGMALFVPSGRIHRVEALGPSVSVAIVMARG
jgi:hypothetical protein